jgi:hypothetical protein
MVTAPRCASLRQQLTCGDQGDGPGHGGCAGAGEGQVALAELMASFFAVGGWRTLLIVVTRWLTLASPPAAASSVVYSRLARRRTADDLLVLIIVLACES